MIIEGNKSKLFIIVFLLLGACYALVKLSFRARSFYRSVTVERSTYSIVGLDPESGDVGIAGASCVPISAGAMTSMVPGMGVAATQAAYIPQNHARMFDLLRQGATANQVIAFVSDNSHDSQVDIRQYGAVTLKEGLIQAAGFTGKANNDWAGDQQDSSLGVSVQGNTLASPAVVADALAAFRQKEIGAVELPDRLLRALEAASAAGGDRRCNQGDFQQTALAAFIAVAKVDQMPFAARLGKDPDPNDPSTPWLYISVIEPKGGPNPLLELRSRYDAWRPQNLPPCADCDLNPIPVPPGGDPKPFSKTILWIVSRIGLVGAGIGCLIGVVLLMSFPVILYFRSRKKRAHRIS